MLSVDTCVAAHYKVFNIGKGLFNCSVLYPACIEVSARNGILKDQGIDQGILLQRILLWEQGIDLLPLLNNYIIDKLMMLNVYKMK